MDSVINGNIVEKDFNESRSSIKIEK